MKKTIIILSLQLLLFPCNLFAQPAQEKVMRQADKVAQFHGLPAEEIETRINQEKEYLDVARSNIELYRKGEVSIVLLDSLGKPLKNAQIEINQTTHDFLFGNLAFDLVGFFSPQAAYEAEKFKKQFKKLFNLAILPFYWGQYEKTPGQPNWYRNEEVIKWCKDNGISCKGHPLGWTSPSGTPKWLMKLPANTAEEMYKARIYNNVIGYKGSINIWDVVNEPVNTIPWDMAMKDTANNNDYRYNMDGIEIDEIVPWVEKSFKWAYDANPEGTYILNEYFTLAIPEIRDRFYKLLKELRQRNTPISAIGIQAHEPREMWFSPVEVYKTFDMYKEFNLPVHVTEFIPQSSGKKITGWRRGVWTEAAQAEFAEQFYTLAFGHPSVASITWWGLSDRDIWLEGGGLLDREYNPKPVFITLERLIRNDWMTKNVMLRTDKKGATAFRGFFGQYEITVRTKSGDKKVFCKHLEESTDNQWIICF